MYRVAAFASKPAPTWELRRAQVLCTPPIQCGSGLAREWARLGISEDPGKRVNIAAFARLTD
ncbi:hypothetical protein CGA21_19040 [Pseudomonas sp. PSB11]|nr:hypothetical protein [Pseudomonas sp. PSB11]